jgi:predicted NBD/HSP70 family sugar kinase
MGKNPSQQATKKKNKLAILSIIRRSSPIAQTRIAGELQLRASTVSNLCRELREKGFIEISGKGSSGKNGGKRSTLLSIAPSFAYFSGIYIHQDHIVSHLIDYQGNIRHTATKAFNPGSPDTVIDFVTEEIRHHSQMSASYRGAGISVSSIVNFRGGVSTSPDFPWEIPDFTSAILDRTDSAYPVVVENDANSAALYMYHLLGEQYPNLLLFFYNHPHRSLGGALIIRGQLYRGSRGDAGEIIHQEKSDIVASFSAYIARIASFIAPDQLIIVGDNASANDSVEAMHRLVRNEIQDFPVSIHLDPDLPVMGAAYLISTSVTETLV